MFSLRQGRLAAAIVLACLATPSVARSQDGSAQIEVTISDELIEVLLGSMALSDPGRPGFEDTESLLANLVADPLVVAVLQEAGAEDLALPTGKPAWATESDHLREALGIRAPVWLADAIQVSVDYSLPSIMPLNVLLLLVEEPDAVMTDFLKRHALDAQAVEAMVRTTLEELGRRSS